jgi:spermidine synthase
VTLEQPAARAAGAQWLLPLLLVLFFCSGMSALVYQVLWLRLLALVFGVTVWAASTVLASFMGGLALGSFTAGRLVDRVRNPLLLFGVAEALVGLSALLTQPALNAVEGVYAALHPSLPPGLAAITLVRFILSFAVLIVPATLMGATLPIVVRSSLVRAEQLGPRVSLLYATNTAGAIAGTLLAGFYLIGGVGISGSFRLAAAVNFAVALVAGLAALRLPESTETRTAPARAADAPAAATSCARRAVLAVFTLSGFASLAVEVIWFRLLVLFQDVTTYAFTVMLATYLLGIALGSYAVTPLMRRRVDWLVRLAVIELAIGVVCLLSMAAMLAGFGLVEPAERLLGRPLRGSLELLGAASLVGVLPTTLLLGVAFPIGLRLWAGDGDDGETGRRIGAFYSLNVLGAIGGSVAAGFVLLPLIRSRPSLIVVAAISLFGGLLLLAASRHPRRLALGALGVAAFAAVAALIPNPAGVVNAYRRPGEALVWHEEGIQTTVDVVRNSRGHLVMFLDGWGQASDDPGTAAVHRYLGFLPTLIHPDPREALVVGLGGGATAGAVARYPTTQVDDVELSASVVRGSEHFRSVNFDVLRNPRARLLLEDGRNHLMVTRKRYDVVTADVIWALLAGAGNLYSKEYFELIRDRLDDDGIVMYWSGAETEEHFKVIVRTFLTVFPDASFWHFGEMMVGSKAPLRVERAAFDRRMQDPEIRETAESIGIRSYDDLAAQFRANADDMRRYVGDGPILTDDRPLVEYYLSLSGDTRRADLSGVPRNPAGTIGP